MKVRFAFTLIEMMLVIAVLGLACASFGTAMKTLFEEILRYDDELKNQEMLTDAFALLKKAFADSESVIVKNSNEALLIGGKCDAIRRENDGRTLVLYKGKSVFHLKHGDEMICGPFEAVDGKTLKYSMKSIHKGDKIDFKMYWRCGM